MKSKVRGNKSKDPLRVLIGKALRKWRKLNGDPKQAEVASRAVIPVHWVGAYERGERSIDSVVVVKICMALSVKPEAFVMDLMEAYKRALHEIEQELRKGAPAEELQKHPSAAQAQENLIRSLEPIIELLKRGLLLLSAKVAVDSNED